MPNRAIDRHEDAIVRFLSMIEDEGWEPYAANAIVANANGLTGDRLLQLTRMWVALSGVECEPLKVFDGPPPAMPWIEPKVWLITVPCTVFVTVGISARSAVDAIDHAWPGLEDEMATRLHAAIEAGDWSMPDRYDCTAESEVQ